MKQSEFFYKNPNAPKPNKPNLLGTTMLIEYNNMLLLEHRADSDRWAIVGGSLQADESLIHCAIRETREETAIELTEDMLHMYRIYDDPSIIISYPDGNVFRSIMVVYQVTLRERPELVCSAESRELKFFTKEELRSVQMVETHIPILQDYLKK